MKQVLKLLVSAVVGYLVRQAMYGAKLRQKDKADLEAVRRQNVRSARSERPSGSAPDAEEQSDVRIVSE